ncbi:hypothetical protein C8R46DRAFT_1088251 [Mycena filopes]|nr:hypothetical protein C8R46DRAFT_1088251 [Mycena filopes]
MSVTVAPLAYKARLCAVCAVACNAHPYPYHAPCQGCGANCGTRIFTAADAAQEPPQKKMRPNPANTEPMGQTKTTSSEEQQSGGAATFTGKFSMYSPPKARTPYTAPPPYAASLSAAPATVWRKPFVYREPSHYSAAPVKRFDPAQQPPTDWVYTPRDPTLFARTALITPIPTDPTPASARAAAAPKKPTKKTKKPSTSAAPGNTATPTTTSTTTAQQHPLPAPAPAPRIPKAIPRTIHLPLVTDPGPAAPFITYQTLALLLTDLNRLLSTPHEGQAFAFRGTCAVVAHPPTSPLVAERHYRARVAEVGWDVIAKTVLAFDAGALGRGVGLHSGTRGAIAQVRSAAIWMGAPRLEKQGGPARPCEKCEHILKISVWEERKREPVVMGESIFVELSHFAT